MVTADYHQIRRKLEKDRKYTIERILDPSNPKSSRQRFYNPNIIQEFDATKSDPSPPEDDRQIEGVRLLLASR